MKPRARSLMRKRPSMPLLRGLPVLPLVLALSACVVGPNYKLPERAVVNAPLANAPLPDVDGQHISQQPVPPNWWHLYDDPVLEQLVSEALESNTDLRVAAANLARSQEALGVAQAQGGFSGKAETAFARAQESGEQYLMFEKIPVVNEGDVGISISYEFDVFGKLKRGVEAASADSEATLAAADLARITVVANVVRAYIESCSAGDELNVAQKSLALQKERLDVSRRLLAAGRGNQPDVTSGQTQVESLTADIPRYQARRKIAQYQLAMLLARAPSDLPPAVMACDTVPKINQPIPVGDGAALLRRRPDVREAERQLAASTARIGVATGALYPTVSFGAGAGMTGVLEDLGTQPTDYWRFGPLISWTFPTNGARGRVREAQDASTAALAHFDGVVLNALRETQTSLATYVSDYTRYAALQAALKSAAQSADETHRLYVGGRESFINDLDATRTLTATRAQVAAAEGQVALDQANLFLALGGGWETADRTGAAPAAAAPASASASAPTGAANSVTSATSSAPATPAH
jgi:NodT family efflux transporter outer membrane factor (OMF) lipoprotein